MKPEEDKALTIIDNLIGEHFVNYSVQVLTEDGELCYCNSTDIVGKALIMETLQSIRQLEEEQSKNISFTEDE
jgi:hypothetical protein